MASTERGQVETNNMAQTKQDQSIDLDKILVEELGQFGPYQVRVLRLAVVAVILIGWNANEYVFTAGRIPTRCLIPECEKDGPQEFLPPWLPNAVPPSGSSFDNCARYVNTSAPRTDACPAELFNSNRTVACEEYVYENTNTIVYDFGLACDEWSRTLIGLIRKVGTLVCLPLSGYMSDRWGRRTTFSIVAFNGAWLGATRYWANTYLGFLTSTFIESSLGSGAFAAMYVLVMEIMGPKYRVFGGAILNSAFATSQVFVGLIAWMVPTWRELTLSLYIPQMVTIGYLWIMTESVRWLMTKGRYEESERILKDIARVNKTSLSEKSLQRLRQCVEEENERKKLKKSAVFDEPWLIVQVFRNKAILLRCIVAPVWWIAMTLIYYGLSINATNISGNQYLNYVAVSAVEIPGYWTAVFLMNRVGRKFVMTTAFWMCAICQIGYIFISADQNVTSLTVYLIGKYSISMVVTSIYVYTAELYPTKHRQSLCAYSSMVGRLGSFIAPLTPAIGASSWEQLPFALFAGFALVSGALVLLTPETRSAALPDTMQQAAHMHHHNSKDT